MKVFRTTQNFLGMFYLVCGEIEWAPRLKQQKSSFFVYIYFPQFVQNVALGMTGAPQFGQKVDLELAVGGCCVFGGGVV
jgi:hypothetical protein